MNELFKSIQIHLGMLDLAISSSYKIVTLSALDDVSLVEKEVENRERLMSAIDQIQTILEKQINMLHPHDISQDEVMILKSWFYDVAKCADLIVELDAQAIARLTTQKEDTTAEIAHLFKSKQNFKGYSTSSKK